MIKIVTLIGARPQIIKAAALSRVITSTYSDRITEVLVHTGQHYDSTMSQVFFDELELPKEKYNLEVGSGTHAQQTARMLLGIEDILIKEKPDCLLLYGDTNSTLAGALTAAKRHLPVIHVEGGVRSYNKSFPEEVNRVICDHLSTLIFVPTISGIKSLQREGFADDPKPPFQIDNPKVYYCGDIMYDNSLYFAEKASAKSPILKDLDLNDKQFALVTMHRPSNVDDPETLASLFNTFDTLAADNQITLVIPLHPRTMKAIENNPDKNLFNRIKDNSLLKIIPAVSFFDMINLERRAAIIFTDSGGVQKEAFYFEKPCVILLDETPWVELVESGTALLTGSNGEKIKAAYQTLMTKRKELKFPSLFGDGHAAAFICEKIIENFDRP
ncbi:MAG TPA: UDP-N-acetylglucosamine 2-epimerase (non-hydrolyzing) [Cyclobacteriaceae bacterium]